MEKRFSKTITNAQTGRTRTVKFGQAGNAADGGDRIRPTRQLSEKCQAAATRL